MTKLNGEIFNDKIMHITYWDGKENFKHTIESKEVEQQRLDEFG